MLTTAPATAAVTKALSTGGNVRLREWIDAMVGDAQITLGADRYALFVPEGVQLEIDGDGLNQSITWDSAGLAYRHPSSTSNCLWDLVDIAQRWRSNDLIDLADLLGFVSKWGLLNLGPDGTVWDIDRSGYAETLDWIESAFQVYSILTTLVATENGELVDEETLWDLRAGDDEPPSVRLEWIEARIPWDEQRRLRDVEWRESFKEQRSQGRGVELQQRLVAGCINENWVLPLWPGLEWDHDGRRIETEALGASAIICQHLMAIFASVEMDVSVCSICGRPYLLSLDSGQRRPRQGVRRFCSEVCRVAGRREANRASWHRNKHKWM